MKQTIFTWIVVAFFILALVQSFQISSLEKKSAMQGPSETAGGTIDFSGWTEDEKMQYEHHGTMPARLDGSAPQQQSSMAGAC
ncbi:MAG: hypothetical protein AABX72_04545 [Nanoarchaeota archaeon]